MQINWEAGLDKRINGSAYLIMQCRPFWCIIDFHLRRKIQQLLLTLYQMLLNSNNLLVQFLKPLVETQNLNW